MALRGEVLHFITNDKVNLPLLRSKYLTKGDWLINLKSGVTRINTGKRLKKQYGGYCCFILLNIDIPPQKKKIYDKKKKKKEKRF